jgi:hypothetical protein
MLIDVQASHLDISTGYTEILFPKSRAALSGSYLIRGGVCWPGTLPKAHNRFYAGALAIAGLNLRSRVAYLFGATEFQSVPAIRSDSGAIRFPGIHSFTNQAWARFFCRTYYWRCDFETHRARVIEADADPMIDPKPEFPEARWDKDQGVLYTLQAFATKRLVLPVKEMEDEATGTGQPALSARMKLATEHVDSPDPDVYAVACAMSGLANETPERIQ